MNRFMYWLRMLLEMPISYQCEYDGTCRCGFKLSQRLNNHLLLHGYCDHCTNPLIFCTKCGTGYLDRVPPDQRYWQFSLWRGWRHRLACPK